MNSKNNSSLPVEEDKGIRKIKELQKTKPSLIGYKLSFRVPRLLILIFSFSAAQLVISLAYPVCLIQAQNNNNNTAQNMTTAINQKHNNGNSILQMTTDKKTYKLGETVTIAIKNNGKITLEFADSLLGLIVKNVKTGQQAGILGVQVISELKPNESKVFQWDQKDTNSKQVEAGIYNAQASSLRVNTGNNTQSSTVFTILNQT
jgi:uncharacterized cupredoxin-like copper-binding protein